MLRAPCAPRPRPRPALQAAGHHRGREAWHCSGREQTRAQRPRIGREHLCHEGQLVAQTVSLASTGARDRMAVPPARKEARAGGTQPVSVLGSASVWARPRVGSAPGGLGGRGQLCCALCAGSLWGWGNGGGDAQFSVLGPDHDRHIPFLSPKTPSFRHFWAPGPRLRRSWQLQEMKMGEGSPSSFTLGPPGQVSVAATPDRRVTLVFPHCKVEVHLQDCVACS